MLTVDGAQGGGQIVRTTVSYSALSGRAVRVINIRAGRPRPGLQAQHLVAVRAVAELCTADVTGAALGSTAIEFRPGPIASPDVWRLDVGTAGSVMLILQALLPCLALGGTAVDLTLTGGTNNPWAPAFEHTRRVLLPALLQMGVKVEAELRSRGFYPRGGGEVRVRVEPASAIQRLSLCERGRPVRVWGIAYSSNLPQHIAERMAGACRDRLALAGLCPEEFEIDAATPSPGAGCGIIALAEFEHSVLAGDRLGERGKPAENVGREAAEALLRELRFQAAADSHLADQLVPWVALASGDSAYLTSRKTDHLASAVAVAEHVVGARFSVDGDEPARVFCRGIGHAPR
jgi:RNA 3'-phosphate cyclase